MYDHIRHLPKLLSHTDYPIGCFPLAKIQNKNGKILWQRPSSHNGPIIQMPGLQSERKLRCQLQKLQGDLSRRLFKKK